LQLSDHSLALPKPFLELNVPLLKFLGALLLGTKLGQQSIALQLILTHRLSPRPLLTASHSHEQTATHQP
jgi:hypothetical protein